MAKDNEVIRVGMDLALKANHFDMEQDFSNALKYYQASIEKLIPLVEGQVISHDASGIFFSQEKEMPTERKH